MELSNIKFYEVARKRPMGVKKKKWVRNITKFEEKVKVIKMKAEAINQKLVNYSPPLLLKERDRIKKIKNMRIEELNDIKAELKRFEKRLNDAIKRIKEDDMVSITGSKETGAVRRAALDLKMGLTKIT